jgi:hypothetical protein
MEVDLFGDVLHRFETTVFADDGRLINRSHNPSYEVAKHVIAWKFKDDVAAVRGVIHNIDTGETDVFQRDNGQAIAVHGGEILDDCPGCILKDKELESKQRDIKAWQARYTNLKKAMQEKAEDSEDWEIAAAVFDAWRVHCHHERSLFSFDRYLEVSGMLKKYGFEICIRAIAGASFDPFTTIRKNGTKKVHNDFELIFRDSKHVEEYSCRAKLPFHLSDYTDKTYGQ